MYISKVRVKNFRLLRDCTLDLRKNLSLLVGRNNTGKTSLMVLLEKFLHQKAFDYNDFPLILREEIQAINGETDIYDLAIRMVMEIQYDENDNLEHLSEFILDLDPAIKTVKILFECRIDKEALLKELSVSPLSDRHNIIPRSIDRYLKKKIYVFDDSSYTQGEDFLKECRHLLVEKEHKEIKNLINFRTIHAHRDVYSSEGSDGGKKPLSAITTAYFNSNNDDSQSNKELNKIDALLAKLDVELGSNYEIFFKDFLKNAKRFLNLEKLSVISNIQSKMLFDRSSEVIYGSNDSHLPEYLNGLGYMNILYLLLKIEIEIADFKKQNKDINLLFIEEPEAHTHPQMQYVFARQINTVLEDIENLQTLITSHSPHIVSQSDFEDIRYLKLINRRTVSKQGVEKLKLLWGEVSKRLLEAGWATEVNSDEVQLTSNIDLEKGSTVSDLGSEFPGILPLIQQPDNEFVEIKNFHTELLREYAGKEEEFKFLKQYLNIQSAELFFASKVIFIEGITECMLLPYFIKLFDQAKLNADDDYRPLVSQNVSILEVGANARAFAPFLQFLDIKTLIITDIDTTKKVTKKTKNGDRTYYESKCVDCSTHTSNETLKYFLGAPEDINSAKYNAWFKALCKHSLNSVHSSIKISYQKEENGYHARSFEDAFINGNLESLKKHKDGINGIKNRADFDSEENIYDLTNKVLDKKSEFAASLLFLALSKNDIEWGMPSYIREGLEWVQRG